MKAMPLLITLAALGLAGCGAKNALEPPKGASLPPRPYGATTTPTPQDLLQPRAAARPERSDDILTDSHEREGDPFDLPPTD